MQTEGPPTPNNCCIVSSASEEISHSANQEQGNLEPRTVSWTSQKQGHT